MNCIRRTAALIASALVLVLGVFAPGWATPRVERITIVGGPPGGVFGIFASGLGTHLSRTVPGLHVSVAATGGSVENIRRVNAGDAEMGLSFASDLHEGYHGMDAFRGTPQTNLRAIGTIFVAVLHVVTYQESRIRTIEDLVGRRVAVGTPGSGTFAVAERVLGKLGVWDRITRVPLLGAAAGAALADGRVDAFLWNGPFPDRVTIEAAIRAPVHLIDVHAALARTDFFTVYPYFSRFVIPAGAYAGMAESTATIATPVVWHAHRNVPAALVQRMVESAYSVAGHEHMLRVHAASRDMTPRRALHGVTIPLHPGAEAHWRAVGLEIPDRIRAR